jgi:hypothetical protein
MNKKRPPPPFLRKLVEPPISKPEPPPRRRAPPIAADEPPRVREEGLVGAIRRNKRLQKVTATASRRDPLRQTADRVRDFMSRNAPEGREVPHPFEGSIYGDDDEGEN